MAVAYGKYGRDHGPPFVDFARQEFTINVEPVPEPPRYCSWAPVSF